MKYLLVGDMHVKLDNIEESRRLIAWITDLCKQYGATPIFMGDQHDTMAIIRAEVLEFWVWAYGHMNNALAGDEAKISTISLTGNHDLNSDGSASAMSAYEKQTVVASSFGYVPLNSTENSVNIAAFGYIRDNDKFIAQAHDAYSKGFTTILCHTEFNGAMYDNGFYAPHGVDLEKCPPVTFISGHIHKAQHIKSGEREVRYIGTPRQLTRSDIGEKKGVVLWDTETSEFSVIHTPAEVAEPFEQVTVTAESQIDNIKASGRVFVDIKGSQDFIKKVLKKIPDNVKVRTFPDQDRSLVEIKESDGIPTAFKAYSSKYFYNKKLPEEKCLEVLKAVYDRCPVLRGNNE